MPKLLAFSEPGYSGTNQGFHSNDPDLTHNAMISENGGPDGDGAYNDYAHPCAAEAFHVESSRTED